ncbi:hypothetical protein C9I50_27205, partial [Pseudomonas prosekii]
PNAASRGSTAATGDWGVAGSGATPFGVAAASHREAAFGGAAVVDPAFTVSLIRRVFTWRRLRRRTRPRGARPLLQGIGVWRVWARRLSV